MFEILDLTRSEEPQETGKLLSVVVHGPPLLATLPFTPLSAAAGAKNEHGACRFWAFARFKAANFIEVVR